LHGLSIFSIHKISITSIESFLTNIGYPYKWCHALCGIHYNNNNSESEARALDEKLSVDSVVTDDANEDDNAMLTDEIQPTKGIDKDSDVTSEEGYLFGSKQNSIVKNESKLMEAILSKLILRFRTRVYLQETINSLST
jgi:hypothetical protein